MNRRDKEPKTWSELGIEVNLSGPTEQDALCPKCSHTRKKRKARCLGVNLASGEFYCHHCGAAGSQEAGWFDEKDWRPRLSPAAPKEYKRPPSLPPNPPTEKSWGGWLKWFEDRGISRATVDRNKITTVNHYMRDAKEGEGGELLAVAFPYFVDGEHVNTKYRAYDEAGERCNQMDGGAHLVPYGLDDLGPYTEWAFWVEGEPDKLAMEEGGVKAALSVPNGAPSIESKNYDSHFNFFHDYADRFTYHVEPDGEKIGVKNWVIATDADPPGRKLARELARMLGPNRCWVVEWSLAGEGIKDANDALLKWGKTAFKRNLWKLMKPWPIDGLFHVQTLEAKLDDWFENGPPPALSTGWELMDPAYKIMAPAITMVTGVPNIGKSTWLNALAINLMANHDWRFAICSPEWRPIEDQIRALAQVLVGKAFSKWSPNPMTREEYEWAKAWLAERVTFILPETPTVQAILDLCDIAITRIGVRGLIIDPWGEIETSHLKPGGINTSDWIGQQLRDIRRYTHNRYLHTWISHHPTKLEKNADGEYPVVDLYDLSGSAKFGDITDFCVSLWRSNLWDDTGENDTEIWIKKARFRYAGKRGSNVTLYFDEETGRFFDRPGVAGVSGVKAPWEMVGVATHG